MTATEEASQQVRHLSRDYEKVVLSLLGTVPDLQGTMQWRYLHSLHVRLTEPGKAMSKLSVHAAELTCTQWEEPNTRTRALLGDLSRNATADLGQGLTAAGIDCSQQEQYRKLDDRRRALSKSRTWLKSRRRRRWDWEELLADAADAVSELPASEEVFEHAFAKALRAAGFSQTPAGYRLNDSDTARALGPFTATGLGADYAPDEIKKRATENAKRLLKRRETILNWAREATPDDDGPATEEVQPEPRRRVRDIETREEERPVRGAEAPPGQRIKLEPETTQTRSAQQRLREDTLAKRRPAGKVRTSTPRRPWLEPDSGDREGGDYEYDF